MPPNAVPKQVSYWDRYPTPDDGTPTQFWVDSPLENKHVAPPPTKAVDDASHPLNKPPQNGRLNTPLPVRQPPTRPPNEKKQELRFFNVSDPKELKNRRELRLNRQHVMHTYLDKERQKPSGERDSRVDGAGAAMRRKRSRMQAPNLPLAGTSGQREDLPTPPESSYASDREAGQGERLARQEPGEQAKKARQSKQIYSEVDRQLVKGLNGTWNNSRYLRADWKDIPFPSSSSTMNGLFSLTEVPDTTAGATLNPFNTWPTFSAESIDVNRLKFSCSRRFGSEGIALHWVPELLRARHAFLSTICISSAHDDIMARASRPNPPHWLATKEGIERMRVRSEVISMVNQSLGDPELRIADATIISVLHLLNSEVMGCDDRVMKTHQDGLHRMVRQRGGLQGLGVKGQLARILTITMYMISVLRESPPHSEFVAYAAKHTISIPPEARIPESPIYCRPSGFQTISRHNCPSIETWELLNTLRNLTRHFILLHDPTRQHRSSTPFESDRQQELLTLRNRIFNLPPCHSDTLTFPDLHSRYTYESLRLAALLYAHALSTNTLFSLASTAITSGTATTTCGTWPAGISATDSLHVQIRNALLKTDCSSVWGPLAGVLFWIALVAGAGANPGPLAQEERVSVEEDGRKFLAAVAVRCSILLSFEFGNAVLEMLKRFVWVESILHMDTEKTQECLEGFGGADHDQSASGAINGGSAPPMTWTQALWTSEPGVGSFVDGQEVHGPEPPPLQQQEDWTHMGDFAWDFDMSS